MRLGMVGSGGGATQELEYRFGSEQHHDSKPATGREEDASTADGVGQLRDGAAMSLSHVSWLKPVKTILKLLLKLLKALRTKLVETS